MERKFDKVKEFFEKENYLLNRVNISIRQLIIEEFFPIIKGNRILDIGCGDGSLSIQFSVENQIVLVDASSLMIEAAKKNAVGAGIRSNITFIQEDILEYDDDNKFDIILCVGVVSHVEDINKLFYRINSLLRPNGKALIQFSDTDHFRYRLKRRLGKPDSYGYALNTFNATIFFQLAEQGGLVYKGKKGYTWQYPIMDRLKPSIQISILNSLRKIGLLSFLNSEWLVLFEKGG